MAKTNATIAAMLNAYKALALFAKFHTGDPGTTGANPGAAGTVSVPWVTATGSPMSGGTANVPCTAGVTYTHIGFYSDAGATTFVDGYQLGASITPNTGTTSIPITFSEAQA